MFAPPCTNTLQGSQGNTFFCILTGLCFQLVKQRDWSTRSACSVFRLLEQLLGVNTTLLGCCTPSKLHCSISYMTSYNLVVCLAPSVLCVPNAYGSDVETDLMKKVMRPLTLPRGRVPTWSPNLWAPIFLW